ncbi:hypothetical protein DINM_006763 [Dirofilaria immitis]|nr:hypothetical protein [Dirofilaria immitis]
MDYDVDDDDDDDDNNATNNGLIILMLTLLATMMIIYDENIAICKPYVIHIRLHAVCLSRRESESPSSSSSILKQTKADGMWMSGRRYMTDMTSRDDYIVIVVVGGGVGVVGVGLLSSSSSSSSSHLINDNNLYPSCKNYINNAISDR